MLVSSRDPDGLTKSSDGLVETNEQLVVFDELQVIFAVPPKPIVQVPGVFTPLHLKKFITGAAPTVTVATSGNELPPAPLQVRVYAVVPVSRGLKFPEVPLPKPGTLHDVALAQAEAPAPHQVMLAVVLKGMEQESKPLHLISALGIMLTVTLSETEPFPVQVSV